MPFLVDRRESVLSSTGSESKEVKLTESGCILRWLARQVPTPLFPITDSKQILRATQIEEAFEIIRTGMLCLYCVVYVDDIYCWRM
jgi:glutathione S-transferase